MRERIALQVGYPFARGKVSRYLKISDETAKAAHELILRTFDAVGERLEDGRPYLTGSDFTAADLTFAALAAVAVFPPEYGGGRRGVGFPSLEELPPALKVEVDELRAHPAGAFVLRLYREERRA